MVRHPLFWYISKHHNVLFITLPKVMVLRVYLHDWTGRELCTIAVTCCCSRSHSLDKKPCRNYIDTCTPWARFKKKNTNFKCSKSLLWYAKNKLLAKYFLHCPRIPDILNHDETKNILVFCTKLWLLFLFGWFLIIL